MNNETKQALRLRAIACKGFRYVPGMRYLFELATGVWSWARVIDGEYGGGLWDGCVVDLDDPATLGCIEHGLLPEMYGDDCNLASWVAADGSTRWTLEYTPDPCSFPHQRLSVSDDGHERKAEALVFALEAAP